jgi:hypothetical protein
MSKLQQVWLKRALKVCHKKCVKTSHYFFVANDFPKNEVAALKSYFFVWSTEKGETLSSSSALHFLYRSF